MLNNTVGSTATLYEGLTGSVSGSTVTLYATGAAGIVTIVDSSGYDANINGTASTIVALPTNEAFRGIAFVPATLTLTGLPGSTNFVTGSPSPVVLSGGNVVFSTTLTSGQLSGSKLTVAITNNGDNANDILGITIQGTTAGEIGVNMSNVTYGGTVIGTYSGGTGGSSLMIAFNSSATEAAVQALANAINFTTTSGSTATRSVQFTFAPSASDLGAIPNVSAVSENENVNVGAQSPI